MGCSNNPKNHHYIPRFYLKKWANDKNEIFLFQLDKDRKIAHSKYVPYKNQGFKTNLYTTRNGDKSVETDFFSTIDDGANDVFKKLDNRTFDFDEDDKLKLGMFINTISQRNPEYLDEVRVPFNPTIKDESNHDDIPKLIKIWHTKETYTAMASIVEKDYQKIISANWKIIQFNKHIKLLLNDRPLQILNLNNEKWNGVGLPSIFGMMFPLTPTKLLVIENNDKFYLELKNQPKQYLSDWINRRSIQLARNQIYSQDGLIFNLVQKELKLPSKV